MFKVIKSRTFRAASILLTIATNCLTSSPSDARERIALLIGNQGYSPRIGALQNPANDIRVVYQALVEVGFQEQDIYIVRDAGLKRSHEILARYRQRLRESGSDVLGFFYYSGHGVSNKNLTGDGFTTNYIIPIDVSDSNLDEIFGTSIELRQVVGDIRRSAPSADLIFIFDACRNELSIPTKSIGEKSFVVGSEDAYVNSLIAFATGPNQVAFDTGTSAGLFASALSKNIKLRSLNIEEIFFNVRRDVWDASGRRQRPWYEDNFLRRVSLASYSQNEEFDAWEKVRASESADLAQRFLENFPQSMNANAARALIARTKEQEKWDEAKRNPTSEVLSRFIKEYPFGNHYFEARSSLQTVMASEENRAWLEAKSINTANAYRDFLKSYPVSEHASTARALAAASGLEASTESQVLPDPRLSVKAAIERNDAAFLRAYIERNLDGELAQEAKAALFAISSEQEWMKLKELSLSEIATFIKHNPDSPIREKAETLLRKLRSEDDAAWLAAERESTPEAITLFLRNRPTSPHAADAAKRLEVVSKGKKTFSSGIFFINSDSSSDTGENNSFKNRKKDPIRRLLISNDLTKLYFAGDGKSLNVVDLNDIGNSKAKEGLHQKKIYAIAKAENSPYILTGSLDRTVVELSAAEGNEVRKISVRPEVYSLVISPTGRWAAASGTEGHVDFIDIKRGGVVNRRFVTPSARIHAMVYLSNRSEDLILGDAKGSLRLWSIRRGAERYVMNAHRGEILAAAISPDGKFIATAGIDRDIKIWDENLELKYVIKSAHQKYITSLRFFHSGNRLASGSGDHLLKIWDFNNLESPETSVSAFDGDIEDIQFSPDDKIFIAASEDGSIRVFETGKNDAAINIYVSKEGRICAEKPDLKRICSN